MIAHDKLVQISTKLYAPAHKSEMFLDIPVIDLYDIVEELQQLRSITSEINDLLSQTST